MKPYGLLIGISALLLVTSCGEKLTVSPNAFITSTFQLRDPTASNPRVLLWNENLDPDGGHCPRISRPCWIKSNPQCGLCPQPDAQDMLPEVCTCPNLSATSCSVSLSSGCCACEDPFDPRKPCCGASADSGCGSQAQGTGNDPAEVAIFGPQNGLTVTNILRADMEVSQDGNLLRIVFTWRRPTKACDQCPTCTDVFAPFETGAKFTPSLTSSVLLQGDIEAALDPSQIVPFVVKGVFRSPRSSFQWGLVMSGEISQNTIRGQLEITDLTCNCTDVYTFDFS